MVKRLLISLIICTPCLYADWITDLSQLVKEGDFNQLRAVQIVKKHVDKDEQAVKRLEVKLEANDEDGFWATLRGGTYQLKWAAAKAQLRYHTKVLQFIKELPKNERDRTNLIDHLTKLNQYDEDLAQLKEQYNASSGWIDSIKSGSQIAAKELQIRSRRALIKSSFIF